MSRRTAALLLCFAALATAALLAAPGAAAQSPGLYSLEGVVHDPAGDPVGGATVTLVPVDAAGGNRTAETDGDGRYAFGNLSEGTYDLVADAPCCGPDYRQVEVSGTQLSRSADLQLADQAEPEGNETVILRGRTQELDGGEAVGGVRVQVQAVQLREARPAAPGDGEEAEPRSVSRREATFAVRSDDDGTYALELPPGRVDLEARKDGYDVSRGDLHLDRHRRVDVPVRASETPAARLGGVLVSDGGEAVADAHVRVHWDRGGCGDRHCPRETPADDASRESDGVRFRVEPAASRYDSTTTGADGRWNLSVHPGTVQLRARAPDHLPARERLEVQGGEERRVNLTLEAIPGDSVRLQGRVTDAETGEPVDRARVQVENHRWGTRNGTWTDEEGAYEVRVEPGYAVVTVAAERDRRCVQAHATATTATAGGDEPAGDRTAGSTVVRPEPCPHEEEQGPGYLPRHRTLVAEAGEDRTFSPALRPAPARSAVLTGWVVNASSQEGVEGATLAVRNEVTGQRGWATTDGDGAFRVNVTPGYYTLRAPVRQHRDAYFPATRNVEVAPDETRTVALNLTPGTPRHRCCVVYGAVAVEDGARASGGQAGASGGAAPDDETAPDGTFRGSGGDLGPYDPSKLGSSPAGAGDERGAPAPGPALAAAALTAAAGFRAWRRPSQE